MFFVPEITIDVISIVLQILLALTGIFTIINYVRAERVYKISNYGFIYGVTCVLLALFLIANENMAAIFIPISIGVWMIFGSLLKIQFCFSLKNGVYSLSCLIGALLMFTIGILVISNPFELMVVIIKIMGIMIFVYSSIDLIETISFKKYMKIK